MHRIPTDTLRDLRAAADDGQALGALSPVQVQETVALIEHQDRITADAELDAIFSVLERGWAKEARL